MHFHVHENARGGVCVNGDAHENVAETIGFPLIASWQIDAQHSN